MKLTDKRHIRLYPFHHILGRGPLGWAVRNWAPLVAFALILAVAAPWVLKEEPTLVVSCLNQDYWLLEHYHHFVVLLFVLSVEHIYEGSVGDHELRME